MYIYITFFIALSSLLFPAKWSSPISSTSIPPSHRDLRSPGPTPPHGTVPGLHELPGNSKFPMYQLRLGSSNPPMSKNDARMPFLKRFFLLVACINIRIFRHVTSLWKKRLRKIGQAVLKTKANEVLASFKLDLYKFMLPSCKIHAKVSQILRWNKYPTLSHGKKKTNRGNWQPLVLFFFCFFRSSSGFKLVESSPGFLPFSQLCCSGCKAAPLPEDDIHQSLL